jgi:hypothetical protein
LAKTVAYGHLSKPKGGISHHHHLQGATTQNTRLAEIVAYGHSENPKGGINHPHHLQSFQKNPCSRGKASSVPHQKKITPRQQ